jgi:hypothetical protein
MSKVQQVTAIISNPSPHDPHRATVGYYVVEGNLLTMTYGDGKPFRGRSGEKITHKLNPGDDPTVIAKRLTLQIHRASRGDGMNFNRPLVYPKIGLA